MFLRREESPVRTQRAKRFVLAEDVASFFGAVVTLPMFWDGFEQ